MLAIVGSVQNLLSVCKSMLVISWVVNVKVEIVDLRMLLFRDVVVLGIVDHLLMSLRFHSINGAIKLMLVMEFFNVVISRPEEVLVIVVSMDMSLFIVLGRGHVMMQ